MATGLLLRVRSGASAPARVRAQSAGRWHGLRRAAVLTALVAVASGQADARTAGDARAVAALRCQKAFAAAVDRYAAGHARDATKCVGSLVRCVLGRPGDDACTLRASATCGDGYEKQATLLASLRANVRKRCDDATLLAADGVGLGGVPERCAIAARTTVVDQAVACAAAVETCADGRGVAVAVPRAAALLRTTGVLSSLPLGTSCLPDYVDVRAVAANDQAESAAPCTVAMLRADERDADGWRGAYDKCLGALVACGSPDGGAEVCWARAKAACDAAFRKAPPVDPNAVAVDGSCAENKVQFEVLANGGGANVGALAATCAAVGVTPLDGAAGWRACVARTAACQVADAVGLVYPRADAFLARVGRTRVPGYCAGVVPVPTATPTPLPSSTPTVSATPLVTSTALATTSATVAATAVTATPATASPAATATPSVTGTVANATATPLAAGSATPFASATPSVNATPNGCDPDPAPFGLTARPVNTTCHLDGDPDGFPTLETARAFPALVFSAPVQITYAPDGSNRLFVVEQSGRIEVFPNDDATTATTTFLDVAALSNYSGEEGFLGLAFHPNYAVNGLFYVFYSAAHPRRSVIAQYHVSDDPDVADPASATVIFEFEKPFENHNGGQIAFGPDGMLYVSVGDGGDAGDPGNRAQNAGELLGKVLRIDVDHADAGLAYAIPPDNPFVGTGGARGEIWALGLRNPWRMSFDRVSHDLWVGDVGQYNFEEIDRIERGANYGWRRIEGNTCFNPDSGCDTGGFTPPLTVYNHSNGACAVIGGVVYRGTAFPELYGAYLYGDYCNGQISALRFDGDHASTQPLTSIGISLSSFGEDHDGEVYLTNVRGGGIYRLRRPTAAPAGDFPITLSATGCFDDVPNRHPAPGLIPYDVTSPLWSDGAGKRRFLALPAGTTVGATASGAWDLPLGTILVKEFAFELEPGNPASRHALETRFLVRRDTGWQGYSYKWNDAQTEAYLLDAPATETFAVSDPDQPGATFQHTHYFPGRGDCLRCHNVPAGGTLGLQTAQLNRDHDYGGVVDNQLRAFEHVGLFGGCLAARPVSLPRLVDPADVAAPLATRARSYLHANCSHCHRQGGIAPTAFDLRADVPFAATGLCDALPQAGDLGLANARILHPGHPEESVLWLRAAMRGDAQMPPLATFLVDPTGSGVLADWITSLPDCR